MKNRGYTYVSMVVIVIMVFVYMHNLANSNNLANEEERVLLAEAVSRSVEEIDFNAAYPSEPEALVEANSEIMLMMYGGIINEADIPTIFEKQRMLYAREWLELNPFNEKYALLAEDILKNQTEGKKILSYEIEPPQYDAVDQSICTVNSLQTTNTVVNNQVKYYLIMEDDKWKILAWEAVPIENTEVQK